MSLLELIISVNNLVFGLYGHADCNTESVLSTVTVVQSLYYNVLSAMLDI